MHTVLLIYNCFTHKSITRYPYPPAELCGAKHTSKENLIKFLSSDASGKISRKQSCLLCLRYMTVRSTLKMGFIRKTEMPVNAVFTGISWRRRRDSNPRAGYPANAFRVRPVMTTSIRLHSELIISIILFVSKVGKVDIYLNLGEITLLIDRVDLCGKKLARIHKA